LQVGKLQGENTAYIKGWVITCTQQPANMQSSSKFHDWASMARLPNIPTVWSNVFTAWVLAVGPLDIGSDHLRFLLLGLLGGSLVYVGGTILNDVLDLGFDRIHRPERPLPAGRISLRSAKILAWGFLGSGALLLLSPGYYPALPVILLAAVIAYTMIHKKHRWLAVPLMGLCRAALVTTIIFMRWGLGDFWGHRYTVEPTHYAGVVWLYVSGISFLALGESNYIRRKMVGWMLALLPGLDAIFLICAGHAMWASVPLACFALVLLLRRYASAT
jgi:4-hydroxybenzoate polyprenyltransferase